MPNGLSDKGRVSKQGPEDGGVAAWRTTLVQMGPRLAKIEPVVRVELDRVEVLELLGMTLAHLNDAEARAEVSPRVPLLMAIRDKLALALREET
jgi:hypothetical protein